MKAFIKFIISPITAIVLLAVFAISIGAATFIEEYFDTLTSKMLVYNSKWMELLLILLCVNLIGSITRNNLFRKEKIGSLLFHLAFIIMIIGATVTRYVSFEGSMNIREGSSSNIIYSSTPHLSIIITDDKGEYTHSEPLLITNVINKPFQVNLDTEEKGEIIFEYKDFFKTKNGSDAIVVTVIIDNLKYDATVFGGSGYVSRYQPFNFGGASIQMGFGDKKIEIPFSIYLDDFILERYAGSMSPSSFASEVILIDEENNVRKHHRIFMNNILDYGGYRFFQSSYDQDEKGTILSVNHDFYGTWISYLGYFFLGLGFVLTIFNKNSRFLTLRRNIGEIRKKRKAEILTITLLLGVNWLAFSQNNTTNHVNSEQAEKFGHVICQTYDGRFQPVHSLASDVMHKVCKKDFLEIEGIGKMNGMQIFLDMSVNPEFWNQQKIIYIKESSIRDILGLSGKYASFYDFFDENSVYKLSAFSENAFRKSRSHRNKFDKGIIKMDEVLSILMMATKGNLSKIFPKQGSRNNKWIHWSDNGSFVPLTGHDTIINEDLQLAVLNYHSIFQAYLDELKKGMISNDYSSADKILGHIKNIQQQNTQGDILPSESKIKAEVYYNKLNIFVKLKKYYAYLSVLLLLFAFIDNLRVKKSKFIRYSLNFFIVLLGLAFAYHTYGMGLRWYLTDHAPWSNGYEAMLLVGWGSLLAGFCFVRNSKITLAATSLLAFFVLMIAGFSNYNPQLTNLVPVLKSYWLIIHVAAMTVSYGFLGLGFVLGLMNLILFLFKNKENENRLSLIIKELTYINEMNLTIGLILAVLGCFLGAVWANESWGRYWGWDAKETWALVIILCYAIILHLRLIPKMRSLYIFNVASILGFGTVIMTFLGVNYYLSKGMHSYGAGSAPTFPWWLSLIILSIFVLIVVVGIREKLVKKTL